MKPSRRFLFRTVIAAITLAAISPFVQADTFPSKPIRVLVPFPPGGATDVIAREVTQRVSANTGWTFLIENRPGAGGNLGVDAAAKARADGYTIALGQTSDLTINPSLYPKLPYDPLKDLAPVALVANAPMVMVVPANSAYKTLAELVASAKANPGAVNFAFPGNGTVSHLSGELFARTAGITMQRVPYKGAAQALTDLMGGAVQLYLASVPSVLGQVEKGQLRALAVTSFARVADLPNVPTVAEQGYKDYQTSTWFGFVAPAATPRQIVERLNAEINKAVQAPELRARFAADGSEPMSRTPSEFGALIQADLLRWGQIVKASGVRLD